MDSLVARCVDAVARAWRDETVSAADAVALVELLELLPSAVGEELARRHQHVRWARLAGGQRADEEADDEEEEEEEPPTAAERTLWAALVRCKWLTEVRVAALPRWLLLDTRVDWAALPLRALDCAQLTTAPSTRDPLVGLLPTLSLTHVRSLSLRGLDDVVTDALLQTLAARCHCLEELDVSYCALVGDAGVADLVAANCLTLRTLRANGLRQLRNPAVETIERCSYLQSLELEDCACLQRLPRFTETHLSRVTSLNLQGLGQFTDQELGDALTPCFSRLDTLKIGETELAEGSLLRLLDAATAAAAVGLRHADLSWCPHITSDALAQLVQRAPLLDVLRLRCSHIEDATLEAIGARLLRLRVLDLERCDALTSLGFDAMASAARTAGGLRRLEKLNVSWTSVGVAALANVLRLCGETIRKVRLQGCKGVNRTLVDAVATAAWPRLQLVDCSWVNDLSDDHLRTLAKSLPHDARVIGYYGTEIDN